MQTPLSKLKNEMASFNKLGKKDIVMNVVEVRLLLNTLADEHCKKSDKSELYLNQDLYEQVIKARQKAKLADDVLRDIADLLNQLRRDQDQRALQAEEKLRDSWLKCPELGKTGIKKHLVHHFLREYLTALAENYEPVA